MDQERSATDQMKLRERISVIMKVQSGLLTASAAAKMLGVSRKTYYELESRALAGLLNTLGPKTAGRPKSAPDPEKQQMAREIRDLKREVALNKVTIRLRDMFNELKESEPKKATSKKKRPGP